MTKRTNTGLSMAGLHALGGQANPARSWAGLTTLWCTDLADLATLCAGSFADEETDRIRALYAVLAAAPDKALIRGLELVPAQRFERLVAMEAGAAAVIEMFGPAAGYLLSRGATGLHAASVYLPDAAEETTAIGDSLALALVGAVAQALVDRIAEREPAPVQPAIR